MFTGWSSLNEGLPAEAELRGVSGTGETVHGRTGVAVNNRVPYSQSRSELMQLEQTGRFSSH